MARASSGQVNDLTLINRNDLSADGMPSTLGRRNYKTRRLPRCATSPVQATKVRRKSEPVMLVCSAKRGRRSARATVQAAGLAAIAVSGALGTSSTVGQGPQASKSSFVRRSGDLRTFVRLWTLCAEAPTKYRVCFLQSCVSARPSTISLLESRASRLP